MPLRHCRIDELDPGAVPGASTIYGGEIGSTGVVKAMSRQKATTQRQTTTLQLRTSL
jgi:hypothetical protein